MADQETLLRFESFREALCNGSLELQIKISKQMANLAQNLGPEFTRTQLLPFIKEYIDINDEILVIISEQLEHFIPLVGGYDHSQPILDLLIKLCNSEETFVRDRTVQTLRNIAENLNREQMERLLLPVVETLGLEEDWFTSKCSAAALYPIMYQKVSDEKKAELRNNFRVLIQDESPIVRRVTALRLLEFIPLLEEDSLRDQFIPVFDNIAKDDMDSVRVYAVDVSIELAKRLTQNEIEEFIFQTIEGWAEDSSWRIRQRLAQHIAVIQEVIPFGKTRGKILAMYQKLVKDPQCEVRKIAAGNLVSYCKNLKKTYEMQPNHEDNFEPVFQQSIVPQIKLLVSDGNDEIRFILSSIIVSLGSVLREECFKRLIMPLIVEILEGDPSTPVQANILNSFDTFPASVDITQSFHSIRSVLRSLIVNSSTHWRTRRSLLVAIMHIAKRTTKQYFSENLKVYYAALLGDPVFSVRRSAPVILPLLAKEYGIEWTVENIIPYFTMYKKDCRYLYRYVPLFGILELMYPSLDLENKPEYLRDLKVLLENSTNENDKKAAVKVLAKLSKLVEKIRAKFEEQPYNDILCIENVDDFKNDDISLYMEDTTEVINENHKYDIFSIEKHTVLSGEVSYLEGLLQLIYSEYLTLTLTLFEDPIVNIQIRSVHVFYKIKQFVDALHTEFSDAILVEAIETLSPTEMEEIAGSIDVKTHPKAIESEEEKIDTELMEATVLTDFDKVNLNQIPDIIVDTIAATCPSQNVEEDAQVVDRSEESTN